MNATWKVMKSYESYVHHIKITNVKCLQCIHRISAADLHAAPWRHSEGGDYSVMLQYVRDLVVHCQSYAIIVIWLKNAILAGKPLHELKPQKKRKQNKTKRERAWEEEEDRLKLVARRSSGPPVARTQIINELRRTSDRILIAKRIQNVWCWHSCWHHLHEWLMFKQQLHL